MDKRIITFGIVFLILAFAFGWIDLASIFPDIRQPIICSSVADDQLSCSMKNVNQIQGIIGMEGNSLNLGVENYQELYKGFNAYQNIMYSQSNLFKQFEDSHERCEVDRNRLIYKAPEYQDWDGSVKGNMYSSFGISLTDNHCGQGRFPPYRQIILSSQAITENYFKNQIIVLEVDAKRYSDSVSLGKFKIVGFCDMGNGNCKLTESNIDIGSTPPELVFFEVNSVEIYLKVGGYTEEDFCSFITCEKIDEEETGTEENEAPDEQKNELINKGFLGNLRDSLNNLLSKIIGWFYT